MFKRAIVVSIAFAVGIVIFYPTISAAQETPFISETLAIDLNNELSGDRSYEHIRWMTHYHRPSGSKGFWTVAQMVHDWARESGLENVQLIKQDFDGTNWDALSGELWIIEPTEVKLGSYAEVAVSIPNNTHSAHETVELVDIGPGTSDEDFAGINVTGKAVLTSSAPSAVMQTAVWQRGASGIVSYSNSRPNAMHDFPDQVAYSRVLVENSAGEPSGWAFMISPRTGTMLKNLIKQSRNDGESVLVKVDIVTEFKENPEQRYVWSEIKGTEIHNQDIVLTSHLQEEKTSANDNSSGSANMVEIGRTMMRLIKEGRIPRPKRDITFYWANEISSEYQFFSDHPEEKNSMLININQDMVGAKQSMGSRVQHIIRTPHSIPSYLSDVIESITEYVIMTNSAFLAAGDAGTPQPFSKPIYSHLGTRERYNAMIVPYFDSSDHLVFNEAVVGVPGVGLINWPDTYIHSTADDLDNIDQTQLKRNAFIVAATALYIANAGDEDVPAITSEVYSRALKRIAKDLNTALNHIQKSSKDNQKQSYGEAKNLIAQAIIRETKAVESVLVFADSPGSNSYIQKRISDLENREDDLIASLDELYVLVSNDKRVPTIKLSAFDKEMDSKIPVIKGTVEEYFQRRGRVRGGGKLHGLMTWECYNFSNGINSYLDIYNAVHAEALSAGEFYYGTVTKQAVADLLDAAVEAEVLRLK